MFAQHSTNSSSPPYVLRRAGQMWCFIKQPSEVSCKTLSTQRDFQGSLNSSKTLKRPSICLTWLLSWPSSMFRFHYYHFCSLITAPFLISSLSKCCYFTFFAEKWKFNYRGDFFVVVGDDGKLVVRVLRVPVPCNNARIRAWRAL